MDFRTEHVGSIDITDLENGMPGITRRMGAYLAEAATYCLARGKHEQGVLMELDGECCHRLRLEWRGFDNTAQCERTWADPEVATEYGACGLAAVLVTELTDYTVVERAKKGTGFDYWLGKKDGGPELFQDKARLEVSGIRSGAKKEISSRLRRKEAQMSRSYGELPGVIAVVEFSSPRTRFKSR